MAREYCKVLLSKGITPQVITRDVASPRVAAFKTMFPQLEVRPLADPPAEVGNWLVCTNIESHEEVCSKLKGKVYCEKPFAHRPTYDADQDIPILMNRRYYYWVSFLKEIIDAGKIVKIIAVIPEKSVDALITQSIHVIDLLWYLAGSFGPATQIGDCSPSYMLSTAAKIPLVIHMNYGAYENFSVRCYGDDGVVYEAKPLEAFSMAEGMEMREADDVLPVRSYTPMIRPLAYVPTKHKPGLEELMDDLLQGGPTRLPSLSEHRQIHVWMQDNM